MSKELGNPFNTLIDAAATDPIAAVSLTTDAPMTLSPSTASPASVAELDLHINALIQHVFAITVSRSPAPPAHQPRVYMEEIVPLCAQQLPLLSVEILDQALFERILLSNPVDFLLPADASPADAQPVVEQRVITYLHGAFVRNARRAAAASSTALQAASGRIEELIVRNAATAVKQPALYEGQRYAEQLLEVLRDADLEPEFTGRFLSLLVREILVEADAEELANMTAMFALVFDEMRARAKVGSLGTVEPWIVPAMMLFAGDRSNADLAMLLVEYNRPKSVVGGGGTVHGSAYQSTLWGELLRMSVLPKQQGTATEFFQGARNATDSDNKEALWSSQRHHIDTLHTVFRTLLGHPGRVRAAVLTWFGDCLHANHARGQLWNAHNPMAASLGAITTVSDAFMIGLAGVLLRLCQPLVRPQWRVLNVDATYCAVAAGDRAARSVHMVDMEKETCLMPAPAAADEQRATSTAAYSFVTECFYMTHRAIDLSYRVCIEQFFKLNREMRRVQQAFHGAMTNGQPTEQLLDLVGEQMPLLMCLQNVLLEPAGDRLMLRFYEASAVWLAQLAAREIGPAAKGGWAPVTQEALELPLGPPSEATAARPTLLASVPEFIVENIVGYLTFMRHFEGQAIDADPEAQQELFTMLLVFMGDAERVRNPHLRARMAEGLESLLPRQFSNASNGANFSAPNAFRSDFRPALFTQHQHRLHCVESVLRVFVGIEMTGQSVQFEQKFNYRRPMYVIMDYLWTLPEQQSCFEQLAARAEREMEHTDPPIFLRFVNLLINDAIFLLDESLANLQQIRTLQQAQDAGEWLALGAAERQQNEANMQHLGQMARFDNILGRDTIRMLRMLTSKISGIFCHAAIRERVAAMLNYFLLHLVGPKMGNFKVKDRKEFEFDPAHTVREICQIYINLGGSDEFALAVSQDGRSYSERLFAFAEEVLVRIGGGLLIGELNEFAQRVRRLELEERVNQEALADAPDEFLDPIMSTLMLDPVRLPSSNVTVDRTTIARHLLSDQSDPFNRSALTMDQVRPDVELRAQIEEWMADKRRQAVETAAKTTTTTAVAETAEPTAAIANQTAEQ